MPWAGKPKLFRLAGRWGIALFFFAGASLGNPSTEDSNTTESIPSAPRILLISKPRGAILFLDNHYAGTGRVETELLPGVHTVSALAQGMIRPPFSIRLDKGDFLKQKVRLGSAEGQPSWMQGKVSTPLDSSANLLFISGTGSAGSWGQRNYGVQVLLADLRAKMEVAKQFEIRQDSYDKKFERNDGILYMNVARTVTDFSWDPAFISPYLTVVDRWMDSEGVLYSKATLSLPVNVFSQLKDRQGLKPCEGKDKLVFFETEDKRHRILREAVWIKHENSAEQEDREEPSQDTTQDAWSVHETIPLPGDESICIVDIQRFFQDRINDARYIESVGLYTCPKQVPVGDLLKDYAQTMVLEPGR